MLKWDSRKSSSARLDAKWWMASGDRQLAGGFEWMVVKDRKRRASSGGRVSLYARPKSASHPLQARSPDVQRGRGPWRVCCGKARSNRNGSRDTEETRRASRPCAHKGLAHSCVRVFLDLCVFTRERTPFHCEMKRRFEIVHHRHTTVGQGAYSKSRARSRKRASCAALLIPNLAFLFLPLLFFPFFSTLPCHGGDGGQGKRL